MLSDEEIEVAIAKDDSEMGKIAQTLLWHNQKLQHDLADPRYLYGEGRATRADILRRDGTIGKLQMNDEQLVLKALGVLKIGAQVKRQGDDTNIVVFDRIYQFHKGKYHAE